MAVFTYHEELDPEKMGRLDPQARKLVEAAFVVARQAHAAQRRGKAVTAEYPNDLPYITHPLMVQDLIWYTDKDAAKRPVLLAAALLHDALEDYAPYTQEPEQMLRDLSAAMKDKGYDPATDNQAMLDANRVYALCEQMTNRKPYPANDKRTYQADRIRFRLRDPDARILKMADQMASLICHLTREDDSQKFGDQRVARGFGNKANDLIRGVLDTDLQSDPLHPFSKQEEQDYKARLRPWRSLYKSVVDGYYRTMVNTPDLAAREKLRAAFLQDPLTLKPEGKKAVQNGHSYHINKDYRDGKGLATVTLNDAGRVISYVSWESPDNEFPWRNEVERNLRNALERHDREVHSGGFKPVYIRPDSNIPAGHEHEALPKMMYRGRAYLLSSPMALKEFLDIAQRSDACSKAERVSLEREVCRVDPSMRPTAHIHL